MILYRTMTSRYNETTSFLFIIQRTIFEIRIPTQGRVGVELTYFSPANEVCEGYVFTGVCLSTVGVSTSDPGGCLPHTCLDRHTPGQTHPIDRHRPPGQTPSGQTPPRQTNTPLWADILLGRHPPADTCVGRLKVAEFPKLALKHGILLNLPI